MLLTPPHTEESPGEAPVSEPEFKTITEKEN